MRLADSIEKHGYFWLPSEEENALYGTLEISKKGQITLELMVPVEYPKSIAKKPWAFRSDDDNISFNKIIGKVEGDEFVTLCQCECLTPFSEFSMLQAATSGGVSLKTSKYISQYAIVGKNHFGKKEEKVLFSRCTVSFEELEKLLNTGSISVEWPSSNRVTMEYNRPDPISFEIPYESNEIELTLDFRPSNFSLTPRSEFSIKQKPYISLSSNKPLSFDDCRNLIWRINKFLCLAIDEPVSFDSVTVFSKGKLEPIGDEKRETPMKLYFIGNSHPEIKTEILWGVTCLFFYKINEIKEFVNGLSCWMQNYEKYNIPINLYFASVHGGGHIEQKFLSLAQGIEVLHGQSTDSIEERICLSYRIKEVAEKLVVA